MSKRAAIYVRTSSEKQAEKVSPEVQEADCRELCRTKGNVVVAVYRDTERYRVGKRLVEPSGTRADRPGLKRMLADARAGKFDVITGWREDRLYRSSRPMLDVLDCLEETKIEIELAKETFDKRIAPVKAWAAKMELDARKDRTTMGMTARFARGKVWTSGVPYGFGKSAEGTGEVNPAEAKWVKTIWEWKAAGRSLGEIRQMLIENNVSQRRQELCKHRWQICKIQRILRNPVYYTGIQQVSWDGNAFEIQYPILVDAETARQVIEMRARENAHPARHLKYDYLGLGLAYCWVCKRKMVSLTTRAYRRKGEPRDSMVRCYRCANFIHGNHVEGCARQISVKKLDAELWRKVMLVLTDESDFADRVQQRVEELKGEEADAEGSIERIKRELGQIGEERHWVITRARKKTITEADMEQQLAVLDAQGSELRRELSDKSMLIGDRAGRLIEFANRYRAGMRGKLEWLNHEPRDEDERGQQFRARREIVEAIVRKANVYADKSVKVEFEFDLTGMDEQIKDRLHS